MARRPTFVRPPPPRASLPFTSEDLKSDSPLFTIAEINSVAAASPRPSGSADPVVGAALEEPEIETVAGAAPRPSASPVVGPALEEPEIETEVCYQLAGVPSGSSDPVLGAALEETEALSDLSTERITTPVETLWRLREAVFKGDWKSTASFIEENRRLLTRPISVYSRTALHAVACEGNWEFMEKLVKLMRAEDLEKRDDLGCTALHYAAVGGSIKACNALVSKNRTLTQTRSTGGWTPLLCAAHCAPKDKDVVCYLFAVTTDAAPGYPFTGPLAGKLAYALAAGGFHDIISNLLDKYPGLATAKDKNEDEDEDDDTAKDEDTARDEDEDEETAKDEDEDDNGRNILDALFLRPLDFHSGTNLGPLEKLIYNWIYHFVHVEIDYAPPRSARTGVVHTTGQVLRQPRKLLWNCIELLAPRIKRFRDDKLTHELDLELSKRVLRAFSQSNDPDRYDYFLSNTITAAASLGMVEIVKTCLQAKPDIIWRWLYQQTLLKVVVQNRQGKILNLMQNMVVYNKFTSPLQIDEYGNNILHLAAHLAPPSQLRIVSGVALQMQREVQWFKDVEKLVHPFLKEMRNKDDKTAQDVFTEEHKGLLEKAEQWMKDTSNSSMVVAGLIASITFAAAFTVPGGNIESTGIPIFLRDKMFIVFAISDVLGFIFSSFSLLMLLSISTARYSEEDFLESLPKILIMGLASLFSALTATTIAFAATFSIVLRRRSKFVANAVILSASLPPAIYALLQIPLLFEMYQSTYGSGIFRHKKS